MSSTLICIAEVQKIVPIGKSQLYRLIAEGEFPKPVKIRRSSRWLLSEVQAWVCEQARLRSDQNCLVMKSDIQEAEPADLMQVAEHGGRDE